MKFNEFIEEKVEDVLDRDSIFNKLMLLRNRYLENCRESLAKVCDYYKKLSGDTISPDIMANVKNMNEIFINFAKSELSKNLKKRAQLSDKENNIIYKLQPNKLLKTAEKLDAESEIIVGIINEVNKYDDNNYLFNKVDEKIHEIRLNAPIIAIKENKDNKIICEVIAEVIRLTEKGCATEAYNVFDVKKGTYSDIALEFLCDQARAMVHGEKYSEKVRNFKDKLLSDVETEDNILSEEVFM